MIVGIVRPSQASLFLCGRRFCSVICFAFVVVAGTWSESQTSHPDIILVTVNGVRADRMGFLGSKGGLTPTLDKFAGQSMIFERAYAQAPLNIESHAGVLTGTYPQTNGVNNFGGPLAPGVPYLPDLFHTRGYKTAAFVGSTDLNMKNGYAPGFGRGFDLYTAGAPPKVSQDGVSRPNPKMKNWVVAGTVSWMSANRDKPLFVWVNLAGGATVASAYDREIPATDEELAKLIAALRSAQIYDSSILVVASVYGQSLQAHGEDASGIFLYDETIHVPLLVKLPGNESAGKRVSAKVRLIDVAPTMLEAAGLAVPSQMQGQSLLKIAKSNADQPVYSRSDFPQLAFGLSPLESWRLGKYLYIRAPRPELYDLLVDPGATRNLATTSRATLDTMAAQLDALDRRLADPSAKSGAPQLSSSEMQKLASLGYVGLAKTAVTQQIDAGVDAKDRIAAANQIQQAAHLLEIGEAAKAVSVLQSMPPAHVNCYLAQYTLGVALAQKQDFTKAVERLHSAIELQPNSPQAHYWMGVSLLRSGDFKTAIVHLEIAVSRLPEFADAHRQLSEAYRRASRIADAKREASRVGAK